ncbi:hypothetical protein HBA54_24350 [Pelagibius litoralis]|uniref:Smr domain-containing protein n=1 Tax=Pelagibius litoralis TaxID=374515 RepID=A0A967KG11_9PROT|nr:Smr/MutS family protein [Pelagibius litoralis]NIA71730.1 hypothetical protein [Pelagibius litoralis]
MSGKRKGPPRDRSAVDVSAEDKHLWDHVTRQAKPLTGRDRLRSKVDDLREQERRHPVIPLPKNPAPAPKRAAPRPVAKPAPSRRDAPPLAHGTRDGLDRRKAERLKRGKLPIEASLDLHGLRQAEAHRRLGHFLADCQDAGKRCVLVVTGKGLHKEEGGVLRAAVPRWLNEPGNRERVLSFDYTQPKHGGTGALYVLLRRRR